MLLCSIIGNILQFYNIKENFSKRNNIYLFSFFSKHNRLYTNFIFLYLRIEKIFYYKAYQSNYNIFFFLGVYDLSREGHRDGIGNIIPSMSCMFIALSAIIFESLSLTNFVVGYNKMSKFYKVEYYFHFLIFPLCICHIKKYNK